MAGHLLSILTLISELIIFNYFLADFLKSQRKAAKQLRKLIKELHHWWKKW